MNQDIIRNLKDVYAVASKLFPCGAKRLDDISAKGYMGVKLIVGYKLNPSYDVSANPKRPGLTPDERVLEIYKATKKVPDERILWLPPGITADELTNKFLLGIKKSLERKTPIIEKDATGIDMGLKRGKTDAEMAAEIEVGRSNVETNEFDDETAEIEFGEEIGEPTKGVPTDMPKREPIQKEVSGSSGESEILTAINTMAGNIEILAEDLNSVNKRLLNLENNSGEPKKRMGRPPKK